MSFERERQIVQEKQSETQRYINIEAEITREKKRRERVRGRERENGKDGLTDEQKEAQTDRRRNRIHRE